jgi:hypothetical protein
MGFLDLLDPSNDPEFFWQVISGPPCITDSSSPISTISTTCTQPVYLQNSLFILYFIFSIATDPPKNVTYFYVFKILNKTKPNTALESKAAFVHLNCIVHEHAIRVNESFAFLALTVNNYFSIRDAFTNSTRNILLRYT